MSMPHGPQHLDGVRARRLAVAGADAGGATSMSVAILHRVAEEPLSHGAAADISGADEEDVFHERRSLKRREDRDGVGASQRWRGGRGGGCHGCEAKSTELGRSPSDDGRRNEAVSLQMGPGRPCSMLLLAAALTDQARWCFLPRRQWRGAESPWRITRRKL